MRSKYSTPLLSTPISVVPDAFLHKMKFLAQDHSVFMAGLMSSIVRQCVPELFKVGRTVSAVSDHDVALVDHQTQTNVPLDHILETVILMNEVDGFLVTHIVAFHQPVTLLIVISLVVPVPPDSTSIL